MYQKQCLYPKIHKNLHIIKKIFSNNSLHSFNPGIHLKYDRFPRSRYEKKKLFQFALT